MGGHEQISEHHVGEWSFDLTSSGQLGHVRYRGIEVVRGVHFVVRDDVWGTVAGKRTLSITSPKSSDPIHGSGFEARLAGSFVFPEGVLTCEAALSVRGDEVQYRFEATANGGVRTNRVGFVVLHPLSLAGEPVEVHHANGSTSSSAFPDRISPHQPFRDLAGLVHPVPGRMTDALGDDARLEILFDGDVFESEDQRNWSDASFKTYSRPLSMPFPYQISNGQCVRQSVTLRMRGATPPPNDPIALSSQPAHSLLVSVTPDWSAPRERPTVGVQLGPDDLELTKPELARLLKLLGVDFARLDVVAEGDVLRGAGSLNHLEGTPLELAIHLGTHPAAALGRLVDLLRDHASELSAVWVLSGDAPSTTPGAVDVVRSLLGELLERVPLIVGTDDNFAELNRNPPDASGVAGIGFSLNPQVHDSSDRAVLETVEAVPAIMTTVRSMAPSGAMVAIGALTLRPRRIIYRPGAIDRLRRDENSVDPRQHTDFAAAWLTATLAALVAAGVDRVTTLELTGARGATHAGVLSRAGRVLADFAAATEVGQPLLNLSANVVAIPLVGPQHRSVLIANLADQPREFRVFDTVYSFTAYQTRLLPEGP